MVEAPACRGRGLRSARAALALVLCVACGDPNSGVHSRLELDATPSAQGGPTPQGGPLPIDGGLMVLPDVGIDAGRDGGPIDVGPIDGGPRDVGVDANVDAGIDAGLPDVGVDAGLDAGLDAGAMTDTGLDANVDAGVDAGSDAGFSDPLDITLVHLGTTFSIFGDLSDDGRYVVFTSPRPIHILDGNGVSDIYRIDRWLSLVLPMSTTPLGAFGPSSCDKPRMSGDGRYVVFHTRSRLTSSDTNGTTADIYVRDVTLGTIELISGATSSADGDSLYGDISANGRYVVFHSNATNLVAGDTNGTNDVFLFDRTTQTTTLISARPGGGVANRQSYIPRISADGQRVVFVSSATDIVAGKTRVIDDVFMRDVSTGTTTWVSRPSSGQGDDHSNSLPEIAASGDYIVFGSWASNLVANDTNGTGDVFLWTRSTGVLERVSVSTTGVESNATFFGEGYGVSNDGRYVFFSTAASTLVPGDTNDAVDVFVRDRQAGTTTRVSVTSTGTQGNGASRRPLANPDGSRVVFESDATNFAVLDTNGTFDVFHRRLY